MSPEEDKEVKTETRQEHSRIKYSYKPLKQHEGLTTKLGKKLKEAGHEAKEKANPFSATNKKARDEARTERTELKKTEREAYKKEKVVQAGERGKRLAKREYGVGERQKSGGGGGRSRGGGFGFRFEPVAGPEINPQGSGGVFVAPDIWGNPTPRKSVKPQTPTQGTTKATTIKTGNKTITIREKAEAPTQEQAPKQKQSQYEYPDPFAEFYLPKKTEAQEHKKGKEKTEKEKNPYDIFADIM